MLDQRSSEKHDMQPASNCHDQHGPPLSCPPRAPPRVQEDVLQLQWPRVPKKCIRMEQLQADWTGRGVWWAVVPRHEAQKGLKPEDSFEPADGLTSHMGAPSGVCHVSYAKSGAPHISSRRFGDLMLLHPLHLHRTTRVCPGRIGWRLEKSSGQPQS